MDMRQLRYFVGVLEARSITKASELLHVAQPALGVHIRNLERELGAKLLHRHARGITPTEAGEQLARQAGDLLRQFDRMRQNLLGNTTAPAGRVLLCVGRTVPRVVTVNIAERCRMRFPDIQLAILDGWRNHFDDAYAELEPDLGITFRGQEEFSAGTEPLVEAELVLAYNSQGQRLPDEVEFQVAAARSLILPSERHYIRRLVNSAAQRCGHHVNICCELESLDTTKELVIKGVADTVLPMASVRGDVNAGALRVARIGNQKLRRTLHMYRGDRNSRSSANDLIRQEVRSIIFEFAEDASFGWRRIAEYMNCEN
jgi:LysR family nitrogen assimilation transcriptional regulator